jgi:hypothetical protein
MTWIAPLRDLILAQAAPLQQHGFSWLGDDEISIWFTDGEVKVSFVVERYSDNWDVWVQHLGQGEADTPYRLDLVMRVMDGASTSDFVERSADDRQRLMARFVRYIIDNKQRLFGPHCPYAQAYEEFDRRVAEQAMAQWSRKP